MATTMRYDMLPRIRIVTMSLWIASTGAQQRIENAWELRQERHEYDTAVIWQEQLFKKNALACIVCCKNITTL
jgi:hypothetical protein